MFHTIDGNDCPNTPGGYQRSWLYNKLAERTGGSKFKLCKSDWTEYFVDIANAVRDSVDVIDCDYDVPRDAADPDNFFLGRLPLDTPFDVQYQYALKQEIAAGQQEELYAAPPNANCPDGTNIIDIDFEDSGRTNTQGTLVYTGSHGFKVYFTDDKSGPKGGVEITNQQSGNCIVANLSLIHI